MNDLLRENGSIMSFEEFTVKYQIDCNFVDYFSLVYAIPQRWKNDVKSEERNNMDIGVQNELLANIKKTKKVCKLIHELCIQKIFKNPVSEIKWMDHFNDINLNWGIIYSISFQASLSTKLRYFQYKILHRYLSVNKLLAQIGFVNSELCVFCNSEVESIQHLFWDCSEVNPLWNQIRRYLLNESGNFNVRDIILGILDIERRKYNFVILHAKYYIYICKWKECKPTYTSLVNFLKYNKNIEEIIASRNNKLEKCTKKWSIINL